MVQNLQGGQHGDDNYDYLKSDQHIVIKLYDCDTGNIEALSTSEWVMRWTWKCSGTSVGDDAVKLWIGASSTGVTVADSAPSDFHRFCNSIVPISEHH